MEKIKTRRRKNYARSQKKKKGLVKNSDKILRKHLATIRKLLYGTLKRLRSRKGMRNWKR